MLLTTSCVLVLALICVSVSATTFVVPHTSGQDDTPGLTAALANFSSNSTILFQAGVTYNIFTPIKFPFLNNVCIQIEGNLTYPTDISAIQALVSSGSSTAWITFTGGSNVTLRGALDPNWGWIDAHGQAWWASKTMDNRPRGISFNGITNGVIRDMKIWNPIAWNFAISGDNVHIFNNHIYAVSTDRVNAYPTNTDGFGAAGTNLLFENNYVLNGDDCLAVSDNAQHIHFRNSHCEGGHGLSIGSLGKNGNTANVANVMIENVLMTNSLFGARFKSWSGGQGLAYNVTWRNITLDKVRLPIYVTQNYWIPNAGTNNKTSSQNTKLQDFLFQGFSGSMVNSGPVVAGSTGKEVIIFDVYAGTASNLVVKDTNVTTNSPPLSVMCNPTAISSSKIGFACLNGQFSPLA